jgi:hypothetical protein
MYIDVESRHGCAGTLKRDVFESLEITRHHVIIKNVTSNLYTVSNSNCQRLLQSDKRVSYLAPESCQNIENLNIE